MAIVEDLDILRPEPKIVKLNNTEFDVSYIPIAITYDIDDIVEKLRKIDAEKLDNLEKKLKAFGRDTSNDEVSLLLKEEDELLKYAMDLSIKLCSVFCKVKNPEMTEDWFKANTSPEQVTSLVRLLEDSLIKSIKGASKYSKNQDKAKMKKAIK